MDNRIRPAFMMLVLVQGLHSVEEYVGRLYEVFPPARFFSSLVSEDLETGFLVINIGLFIFGVWCWSYLIHRNHASALPFMNFWIAIEIINGIGHPLWAIVQMEYTPGVVTAPFLLIIAVYLMKVLHHPTSQMTS